MNQQTGHFQTLPPVRQAPGLFTILADPRAYKALTFMLTAIFTGPFLVIWAVLAIAHSAPVAILVSLLFWSVGGVFVFAGMVTLILILALRQPLCWLEGRLIAFLLDTPMPRPRGSRPYILLRLPLSPLYFLLALVCLLVPSAFLWAGAWGVSGQITAYPPDPFLADEPFWRGLLSGQFVHETAGKLHVHGAPDWLGLQAPLLPGLIALAIGILLLIPLLHLVYAVGQWHGKFAQRMLQASGAAASSDASAATMT
jgi:hypothetical protein